MAYTEFYCDPVNGSNLAGGSDSGSPSMSDTAGTGSWTSSTHVYVSVITSGSVAVGQFMALYSGSATTPTTVARITAVSGGSGVAWTITLSNTAYAGTQPSSVATGSTYKAKVGGAWKGPNGATGFPLSFVTSGLTDASAHLTRVNLLNTATYSITAAINASNSGVFLIQGYSTSPGDGGRATIDGGTSGTSYSLLTLSGGNVVLRDLIIQNNGATGSADGIALTSGSNFLERVTVNNIRGNGINSSGGANIFVECEAYACNKSNTVGAAGFQLSSPGDSAKRCIAHGNTGSNNDGFIVFSFATMDNCISASNGLRGFEVSSGTTLISGCTAYNNGGDGIQSNNGGSVVVIENCLLVSNSAYGVNNTLGTSEVRVSNCAFYSNTSGQTHGTVDSTGAITLASAPLTDPGNGDFSLVAGSTALAGGRGVFEEASASYSKVSTSYPDVGAVQTIDAARNTGILSGGAL
jgi:hypothetical protein